MLKIIAIAVVLATTAPVQGDSQSEREVSIDCLAQNMYHEARGEGLRGMQAVGNVTMDRVNAKGYPSSVCGVVTQKYRSICQFSWFCNKKLSPMKEELYADIRDLAERVYEGTAGDITKGATHFHNHTIRPSWARTKRLTATIGSHSFYRK